MRLLISVFLLGLCFLCWSVTLCNGRLMHLVLLNDAPHKHGAMCLDGSPPGFYFRPGFGDGRSKWIIYLQGGAWCYSDSNCANRSLTFLGSTNHSPRAISTRYGGIMSSVQPWNPDFFNWNVANVIYCDGGSFAGHREESVVVGGRTVYFRGYRILQAVLEALMSMGMKRATDVILTGSSAGAVATYIHADYVWSVLPPGVRYAAVPDAGIFPDNEVGKEYLMGVYTAHNSSGGMDEDCVAEYQPLNEEWKCYFAKYAAPHITSPLFVVNSIYDTGSIFYLYSCFTPDCPYADLGAVISALHDDFFNATVNIISGEDVGFFITSCPHHGQVADDTWFRSMRVDGQLARETFAYWYFGRSGGQTRVMDCEEYQCNESCGALRTPGVVGPIPDIY